MTDIAKTPLSKKLGLKENFIIRLENAPAEYFNFFQELPNNLKINNDDTVKNNFIHYFANNLKQLDIDIPRLRKLMLDDGMLWISWGKKSSKIYSNFSENEIREIALKNKLVDIKVCAVNDDWSALKLVIPVHLREKNRHQ